MSEGSEVKARTYLTDGKVKVLSCNAKTAVIEVSGSDSTPYVVQFNGVWACDCPARKPLCAHVIAAQLVTVLRAEPTVSLTSDLSLDDLVSMSADR